MEEISHPRHGDVDVSGCVGALSSNLLLLLLLEQPHQRAKRYFLFTYVTTTTVPSFPDLQEFYGISYSQVNWTVAIPALGLAVGPLFWSSFADMFGRRIVFLIGTVVALVATIGAAEAKSYDGYMAARFFQGFGVSPAATVGLAIINEYVRSDEPTHPFHRCRASCPSPAFTGPADIFSLDSLFFEHERGQKVGLWVLALDMGLLVGPLSMSTTRSRRA